MSLSSEIEVLNSNNQSLLEEVHSADAMEPVTLQLTDRLSVRIYEDCRPNCLETGALQKGLVLMFDGIELIEEGVGFGVPIVKYEDKTFFSSTAEVSTRKVGSEYILTKVYTLDTVSLKKFGQTSYIDDGLYSPLRKTFQMLYLKHKKLTPIFNKVMELRDLANIKTEFVVVKPRGTITVTYDCQPKAIHIQADFSKVELNKCREILMLNEQGSGTFQKYTDSNRSNLLGSKIGAWEKITAKQASLMSVNGQISFSLQNGGGVIIFQGLGANKKTVFVGRFKLFYASK